MIVFWLPFPFCMISQTWFFSLLHGNMSFIPLATFKCFSVSLVFSSLNMAFLYIYIFLCIYRAWVCLSFLNLCVVILQICKMFKNNFLLHFYFLSSHWIHRHSSLFLICFSCAFEFIKLNTTNVYIYLYILLYTCIYNLYISMVYSKVNDTLQYIIALASV